MGSIRILFQDPDEIFLEIQDINPGSIFVDSEGNIAAGGGLTTSPFIAGRADIPDQTEEFTFRRIPFNPTYAGLGRIKISVGTKAEIHGISATAEALDILAVTLAPLAENLPIAVDGHDSIPSIFRNV